MLVRDDAAGDLAEADAAEAYGREEVVGVIEVEPGQQVRQHRRERDVEASQLALGHLSAAQDVLVVLLALEPLAHLGTRVAGLYIAEVGIEPVARGAAGTGGDDLDDVAVLQRVGQRDEAAVYLGADAVEADIGVNAEGEVDRRGAGGQLFDLAFGEKTKTWSRNMSVLTYSTNSSASAVSRCQSSS